jgi:hypothetical protein
MSESYSYTNLAASALIKTGPGVVHSITLTGGSDAATVVLGDEVATGGDAIITLAAGAGASVCAVLDVAYGVGIYATITGTAPSVTVAYR